MQKKYTIDFLRKLAEEYMRCWSFAEVGRIFNLSRTIVRGLLLDCKDELNIRSREEFLHDLQSDGKNYCFSCFTVKELNEFTFRNDTKKYRNICKDCHRTKHNGWARNNPEARRKWKCNNPEKVAISGKRYRENNKEYIRLINKRWYENNKDKKKEYNALWKKNNPAKIREAGRRRRANEMKVEECYTTEDEQITRDIFSNRCFKCGRSEDLAIDHNNCLSKNNALTVTNAVVLCQSCNSKKGTKDPSEFYTKEEIIKIDILFSMALRLKSNIW